MITVKTNNNEINIYLSYYFQNTEDVGDVFQDPDNMAAILIRKHLQSGDLLMVSYWI